MTHFRAIAEERCRKLDLHVRFSSDMPAGYETALGTYVPETKTLHLNQTLLRGAPPAEALFTLCHELRHAEQYQHPERFSDIIRQSLPYVILYNGQCFKQTRDGWRSCRLAGDEAWFTRAYLSLPYELDANEYACTQLELAGLDHFAAQLRHFWLPSDPLSGEECQRIFHEIDNALR